MVQYLIYSHNSMFFVDNMVITFVTLGDLASVLHTSKDTSMSFFFFFSSRRRHTRCSRDWSSDVCSSDLRSPTNVRDAQGPCFARTLVGLLPFGFACRHNVPGVPVCPSPKGLKEPGSVGDSIIAEIVARACQFCRERLWAGCPLVSKSQRAPHRQQAARAKGTDVRGEL